MGFPVGRRPQGDLVFPSGVGSPPLPTQEADSNFWETLAQEPQGGRSQEAAGP